MHMLGLFLFFLLFFFEGGLFFLFLSFTDPPSSPTSLSALIPPSPLSPSRPKLSSFLPSQSFLLQLLSLQKTWHGLSPVRPTLTSVVPLFLGHHCLKWKISGPAGVWVPVGVERDISKPMSPTWAKSVNGLIYYKHYRLYFTDSRGTIRPKWPGVFLFMYLFIWEEVMGTQGHYQLILLQGAFLWAEEIVCFDLLCKSVPCITTAGDRKRPRPKSSLGSKCAESCTGWRNVLFHRIIPVFCLCHHFLPHLVDILNQTEASWVTWCDLFVAVVWRGCYMQLCWGMTELVFL